MNSVIKLTLFAAVSGLAADFAHAENDCIEGGPHTSAWTCFQAPTLDSSTYLGPTSVNVFLGQSVPVPQIYNLIINNGVASRQITHDCPGEPNYEEFLNQSNNVASLYFVPPMPNSIWAPGSFSYAGYASVADLSGLCSSTTASLGMVTVTANASTNAWYEMIDVDFGGRNQSAETGFAAAGETTNDFWNYFDSYDIFGRSGNSLPALIMVDGRVSAVGLLVTNLPYYDDNGSSDAMYDDYLYGDLYQTAFLTFTNLPAGSWNVYLYSEDGIFDVTAGDTDYGTQMSYDPLQVDWLAWQPGEQYVLFPNVDLSVGQSLTVTISPGVDGVAMISGVQLVAAEPGPPVIVQQPVGQTVTNGDNATFSVVAGGSPPLNYRWLFNGTSIAGATDASFTITNVQAADAGNYAVQVNNAYGSVLSDSAALTVLPEVPVIVLPGVPVITGFSPASGPMGTTVTITGTNFTPVLTNNIVYFGAVKATVLTADPDSLSVTVPAGATYAPITVTVNGYTAWSASSFLVTFCSGGIITNSSLGSRVDLATTNSAGNVVIADLDGDGKPDLVVNNGDHTLWIYRNVGTNGVDLNTNSFAPSVQLPLGSIGEGAFIAADLTGDGKLDLLILDYTANQILVLKNLCVPGSITTNSFVPPVDFGVGSYPGGIAIQDLDGDGRPEIVTANFGNNTISVLRNTSTLGSITTNSFASAASFAAGSGAVNVAIADLDGDRKPDVVVVNNHTGDTNGAISVFQNNSALGDISFAPRLDFPGPIQSYSLAIGDLDGDGKPDLVFVSFNTGMSLSVYRNLSTPGNITTNSFASRVDFPLSAWGNGVTIGDLDGDGKPDVAVVTQSQDKLYLFKNTSTPGNFTTNSLAKKVSFSSGSNPYGVAIGDLNGDGKPDVAFANSYSTFMSIYQNIIAGGSPPIIGTGLTNQTVVGGNSVTFNIIAAGGCGGVPLLYEWYFNGTNLITTTTNSFLTLSNIQMNQTGTYCVAVINGVGATFSSNATLTVLAPPQLTPVAGNNQVGLPNSLLPVPLTALLTGTNAVLLTNALVTFTVTQGGAVFTNLNGGTTTNALQVSTGTNGLASAWLWMPTSTGSNVVVASAWCGSNYLQTIFNEIAGMTPMGAVGQERLMELTIGGDVVSWGANDYGELGDFTYIQSDAPVHVIGLTNIVSIASGLEHSLAIDLNGSLWAWGNNEFGQLGNGSTNKSNIPISVTGMTNSVKAVAGGYAHSVAVKTNGTVWMWGSPDNSSFNSLQPVQVQGLTSAISIAAGAEHTTALLSDGTVWAWGANDSGQLGATAVAYTNAPIRVWGLSNVVAICAGGYHNLALDSNGVVWAWGYDWNGQLGDGTEDYGHGPVQVSGISNIVTIAAGEAHSLAVDNQGKLWAWGGNWNGQLGTGFSNQEDQSIPVLVQSLSNIVSAAANVDASVAVDKFGNLWQWGVGWDDYGDQWSWGDQNGSPVPAQSYIDFYNGNLPNLAILSGNSQTTPSGMEFDQPLVFQVTNVNGGILSNAPVSVEVVGDMELRILSGGSDYKGLRLTTDGNGNVSLIGFADFYVSNTNCLVRILAASRAQIIEADFTETMIPRPSLTITSPTNGEIYLMAGTNQTLTITVNAQAAPGASIQSVDYLDQNSWLVTTSSVSPFSLTITNDPAYLINPYDFEVQAVDNFGSQSAPARVLFTIEQDADGNGLPDWWEIQYFGTTGQDTNSSPDGNGQSLIYDYQNGIDPTDYYDGILPDLAIVGGDAQYGNYNSFLQLPLSIQATDADGAPLTNAPLMFVVATGTAQLAITTTDAPVSSLALRTDSNGLASAWIYFPAADSNPPDSAIAVSATSGTNIITVAANEFVPLGYWPFDNTNTWVGFEGQLPSFFTNVFGVSGWISNAMQVDSVNPALIGYLFAETNGNTNISFQAGTILFWFNPDWSSTNAGGVGPGTWGRLIEAGTYSSSFTNTNGWWGLYFNPDGTQLLFSSASNETGLTNLIANIAWSAGEWHQIALTYSPTGSTLYVDGQLATNGTAPIYEPSSTDGSGVFRVGSDVDGNNQASGAFDELATFSYPLDASVIGSDYFWIMGGGSGFSSYSSFSFYSMAGSGTVSPSITTQPANQIVVQGSNATFTVVASGTAPLSYQWYSTNVLKSLIAQATNATLTLKNVQPSTVPNYFVVVTNVDGAATSSIATLTVATRPQITKQPSSSIVAQGVNTNLSVTAAGGALNYQWYSNSIALLNATNAILLFNNIQTNSAGVYAVTVTNVAGTINSSNAILTVVTAPSIVIQPATQAVLLGSNATLSVVATGGSLNYQWYSNSIILPAATNASLLFNKAQTNCTAPYFVTIINTASAVTSSVAVLTVVKMPSIVIQPTNQTVLQGSNAIFNVSAAGTSPLSCQWYWQLSQFESAGILANATNTTLPLNNAQGTNNGYYFIVVTNNYGAATSSLVTLTVISSPEITLQPLSQAAVQGSNANFTVNARGIALSYQWYFNSSLLAHATNAGLNLKNVQTTNAGSYFVKVTNLAASVTSSVVLLEVVTKPLADSDYDGRSDGQEIKDGTDPFNAGNVLQVGMASWPFDNTNTWVGTGGQLPLIVSNVVGAPGWSNNAVLVDNSNGAVLSYRDVETNGNANINLRSGTIRFWFNPDWSSTNAGGLGPQNEGRLIEMGTQGSTNGWWALVVGSSGTNIYLGTQTNSTGTLTTNLAGSISWTSNTWHQVVLTYSTNNSALYVDSQALTTNGLGIAYWPGLSVRGRGFSIGSSISGTNQAKGAFDQLEIFNYPFTNAVQTNFYPVIWTQPASQKVALGSNVTFTVQVSGTAPLHYQWYRNSLPINNNSSATNATLVLANVQSASAGAYNVVVTNAFGIAISSMATLTVIVPPTITSQPQSQTAYQGNNVTLYVNATGGGLNYQWYSNSIKLAGAISASINLLNVQTNATGLYNVVVSNIVGSVTSSNAALNVLVPPVIIQQPTNQTVSPGSNATFSVTATGSTSLSYQWFYNGVVLNGAINTSLVVTNVQLTNVGDYCVVVSNTTCAVTSSVVTIILLGPPHIIKQPANQVVSQPDNVSFTVVATGTAPLHYQWLRNGLVITNSATVSGVNTNALRLAGLYPWDQGLYSVNVSNSLGKVTSLYAIRIVSSSIATGWGDNSGGQLNGPSSLVNVASIAAPNLYSLALDSTGVVHGWGIMQGHKYATAILNGISGKYSNGDALAPGASLSLNNKIVGCILSATNENNQPITQWPASSYPQLILTGPPSGWSSSEVGIPWAAWNVVNGSPGTVFARGTTEALYNGGDGLYLSVGYSTQLPTSYATVFALNEGRIVKSNPTFNMQVFPPQGTPLITMRLTQPFNGNVGHQLQVGNAVMTVKSMSGNIITCQMQNNNALGQHIPFIYSSTTIPTSDQILIDNSEDGALAVVAIYPLNDGAPPTPNTNGNYSITAAMAFPNPGIPAGGIIPFPSASTTNTIQPYSIVQVSNPNGSGVSGSGDFLFVTSVTMPSNNAGSVNIPTDLTNVVAISASPNSAGYVDFCLALKNNGMVEAWNTVGLPPVPSGLSNVVAVAVGNQHYLALKANGTVVAWGDNTYDQINVPSNLSNVVAIAAGKYYSLALRNDGTVAAWGYNIQTQLPSGLTGVIAVAAGYQHSVALKSNGKVVAWSAWSSVNPAVTNVPSNLSNVVAIAAGNGYSLALKKDGTIVGWGVNAITNIPSNLSNAVAISAGKVDGMAIAIPTLPSIDQQPVSYTSNLGSNAVFSVMASSMAPLNYQWLFNGTALTGATNASLGIVNVQTGNQGLYSVIVNNVAGSAISSSALLTVLMPPIITQQPANCAANLGSNMTFSVTISTSSATPLSYQWLFNGTALSGATNAYLTLVNVQTTNQGLYSVIVNNVVGSVTSSNATFTLLPPPSWFIQYWGSSYQTNTNASPYADSDGDGSSNIGEYLAGSNPTNFDGSILATWRFNASNLVGDQGQMPIAQIGLASALVAGIESNAVDMTAIAGSKLLTYRYAEVNSNQNVALKSGSVIFWFRPAWNGTNEGGAGPGSSGRLINIGTWTANATTGLWMIYLKPSGDALGIEAQDNAGHDVTVTNISIPGGMISNQWVQIAVTYTSSSTAFYVNGVSAGTGGGLNNIIPPQNILASGFNLGTDANGTQMARGTFDFLQTFNYPLTAAAVQTNFQAILALDPNAAPAGDGIPNSIKQALGLNPLVNQPAQSGMRNNYNYDLSDWLNGVSGVKSGSINLDNEGNVLQVTQ